MKREWLYGSLFHIAYTLMYIHIVYTNFNIYIYIYISFINACINRIK